MFWSMAFLCSVLSAGSCAIPWDVDVLKQAPSYREVSLSPMAGFSSLVYESVPMGGTNTEVFAYYGLPEGTMPAGGWPAVVCVHGGGGTAYYQWVEIWNSRGYAALAMDLEGNRPDWTGGFLAFNKIKLDEGGPAHIGVFEDWQDPVEEQWFYHAVSQVVLAHSLLRSFPEINPDKTGLTGISWGGVLTCTVAGLDDRFKFAIPVYGSGFLSESDGVIGKALRDAGDGRAEWVAANYGPANFLPNANCPMLWVNGSNDRYFPLPEFQKSADLVPGPVFFRYGIEMNHSHPSGWLPPEIYGFADSIVRGASAFPVIQSPVQTGALLRSGVSPSNGIATAAICYTIDTGEWVSRKWHTQPASVAGSAIEASIPYGATAAFFNATNPSGLAVSSPFTTLFVYTNGLLHEGSGIEPRGPPRFPARQRPLFPARE